MKSTAQGQLLGYTIQYPRAVLHLLKSRQGDAVCVEHLGDVSTLHGNSAVTSEEDKSSVSSNPLTDHSEDLWKTFYNWVVAINDGELSLGKTTFVIFTNQSGRDSLVNEFHRANNDADVEAAISAAESKLKDLDDSHAIWKYYDHVVNKNRAILSGVIKSFVLEIGRNAGYDEVRAELLGQHFPESQIEYLLESISGWIQKTISEKISKRETPKIAWQDFHDQFVVIFERARKRELIDFTYLNPPEDIAVEHQVKTRPCYIKQLDLIDFQVDEIIEAVSDFLRAKVNRDKWIESEVIDEATAADFESRLQNFWKNRVRNLNLTMKNLSESEFGQLLLSNCKERIETIRDMHPPSSTIAGTYHALANEPLLGWHPNWEKIFRQPEG